MNDPKPVEVTVTTKLRSFRVWDPEVDLADGGTTFFARSPRSAALQWSRLQTDGSWSVVVEGARRAWWADIHAGYEVEIEVSSLSAARLASIRADAEGDNS